MSSDRRAQAGFQHHDHLIVFALVGIVAAIAIPSLLRRANESVAVESLRLIVSAQSAYQGVYGRGFVSQLKLLGPPPAGAKPSALAADLIDAKLASGERSSYAFDLSAVDGDRDGQAEAYVVHASPKVGGQAGAKYFYADQTGVVRFREGAPADATSDPVPKH